jgi:pantetheine-phosphate adenylyltransferase
MSDGHRIAIFPGTFDPITNGHLDVIRRGCDLFDHLIIAIGRNPGKIELFTPSERVAIIRDLFADMGLDAGVESYEGLTADYAKKIGATAIIRGLRNATDMHFEFQLALTNRLVAEIETVFIMTDDAHGFTSSSLIKQIAAAGDVTRLHRLLPDRVIEELKSRREQLQSFLTDGCTE